MTQISGYGGGSGGFGLQQLHGISRQSAAVHGRRSGGNEDDQGTQRLAGQTAEADRARASGDVPSVFRPLGDVTRGSLIQAQTASAEADQRQIASRATPAGSAGEGPSTAPAQASGEAPPPRPEPVAAAGKEETPPAEVAKEDAAPPPADDASSDDHATAKQQAELAAQSQRASRTYGAASTVGGAFSDRGLQLVA